MKSMPPFAVLSGAQDQQPVSLPYFWSYPE